MLGFLGFIAVSLAVLSAGGCERNEDILEIRTHDREIDVEKQPDGGIVIDVEKK
jgi:hypothetical protein